MVYSIQWKGVFHLLGRSLPCSVSPALFERASEIAGEKLTTYHDLRIISRLFLVNGRRTTSPSKIRFAFERTFCYFHFGLRSQDSQTSQRRVS